MGGQRRGRKDTATTSGPIGLAYHADYGMRRLPQPVKCRNSKSARCEKKYVHGKYTHGIFQGANLNRIGSNWEAF